MFITTVREQGSDEQKAYWMPKIEKWEIIGAYGQVILTLSQIKDLANAETDRAWAW
jgi:hypothetical protein